MARLLVVEDESDILDLMARQVTAGGHQVLTASTGAAALELFDAADPPDGALLDVDLPLMDGFDLLTELRKRSPRLPAVFVSVWWSADVIERIHDTGCSLLGKPFSLRDLDAAIASLATSGRAGDGR